MKRIKVFIIAIISVLLIVTLGNVTLADEATVIKSIDSNGKVLINLDDLKTKYANVLCVARGVSVKHGKHESNENSEYYLLGTAEISGNSATLTEYTWQDEYTKMVKGKTEEITTDNGENNKIAAILTTNNFYNGYAGGKVYDENMNLVDEEGSYGPRQLCIWGYWNTWVKSLPEQWQSVFKTSDGNKMKTDQEISWYKQDMTEIEKLVSYYSYKVKISFVEHICKNSEGVKETTGQRLILFEILEPEVEITIEKIWDDIIYDENGNIVADNSGNRPNKLDVLVETYLTETNYDDMVHLKGEDKIVELTANNNWKTTLKLKVRPNKDGYSNINRIYKVKEVVEVQDGQNVKVDVVKVPQGEEPKVEDKLDQATGKKVRIVTVSGEEVSKTYKEPIVAALPKVEVKEENGERILYVAGKKVVRSAYVDNVEVEDVLEVSGHKVVLKANEIYVEPQTEEEIANRTDTPIQNKKYAVVKLGKTLVGTSYILEDQTMIQVVDNLDAGTTGYNQYVESNIDVEDKKIDMTNTRAYVRFTNKLEVVNIPVKKVWNCSDKSKIPEKITIQLLANGEVVEKIDLQTNDTNTLKYTFKNLVKYDASGNEIKYTIQEIEIEGFASEITGDITTGFTITNTYFDGYYEIKGTVWFDGRPGKDSTIDGILGTGDVGIPGVKVTLYYNGKQFDNSSYAYTDDNGEYTIKVNYDNSTNVYKLYDNSSKVEEKLAGTLDENKDGISDGSSYIEFEYDGMVYTTVACNTEENASKAREDDKARTEMDKLYSKVNTSTPEIEYNNKEIDVDGTKKILPAIDYKDNSYWNDVNITASTKGIINSFTDYKFKNIHKEKETVKYCKGDTNGDGIEEYISSVPTADEGYNIVEGQHDCTNCIAGGHIVREVEVDVTTLNGVNLGLMEREKPDTLLDSTIHKVDVKVKEQSHTYTYNEMNPQKPNILGKLYQDPEDAICIRPINSANIVLANKNSQDMIDVYVTYSIGIGKEAETLTTVVNSVIIDYDKGYEIGDEIDNIKIETLNEENNPDTSLTRTIELSSIEIKDMGTHNRIKLDNLNMRAEGKGNISSKQVLLITYKVKPEVILSLINGDKVLNHATEIESYETFYGKETLHAERHDAQQESDRFDKPYAGYDIDSHPGNAGIQLIDGQLKSTDNLVTVVDPETEIPKEQPEDDTDIAPPFKLETGPYTIGGTVWEDKDIDIGTDTEANTYRIGNGIKDEGENTLANVIVTLIDVETGLPAKLYHGQDGIHEEGINAEVKTDENGNYSFATPKDASDEFAGKYSIPAGYKYELKFTYGNEDLTNATTTALGGNTSIENNGARSARNYKSTIISNANTTLYNYFKDEVANVNDKWHLDISDNYSIAIDNMEERLNVDEDLYYGNFDEGKNISAYSKPFIMTIEFTPDNESKVGADGQTITGTGQQLESELDIFDFGIIERAREDLVVSKTINYMNVKLVDNTTLAEGDPSNKEQLNFVKVQGLRNTEISKLGIDALKQRSIRQAMLEMDSEITQGSTVNLQYKIIVTNNSEKDIDYEKDGGNYYKFGIIPENPDNFIMSSSVNQLVTYVNKDLVLLEDTNLTTDWKKYKTDELKDETTAETWISEPTKNAVKDNNYIVLVTEKFAEVKPGESQELQTITANKRLTFKEENAYDVHSEILVIDGKVARTINSVKDGIQIPKTYKSGNFVPSLEKRTVQEDDGYIRKDSAGNAIEPVLSQYYESAGGHEQDDDTVKVTITQPTGITKYITTYVIATLIGLIAIVIGIVFIKKKVLTK